ncbi:Regulator of cell cycle RGCC Response gene to complement 32 protein [Channa argus]|uniref:Regulator of cell cycle RGCC Response gene to complement 32 protein n=1 Tax=Channa argus TaxID=215402 RepID=A0A6G1PTU8_CHAAH|nr:Regulator of cell cycle RGCC Response gene to complement 32 protein [Channa argus]
MSSDINTDLELELGELLQEFQDVVEELKAPSQSKPHAYQHMLQEAKSRTGLADDSGVEDSDYSSEASLGNSLNTSEEELHTAGIKLAPKAKLGDTRELDIFIDMLDRELAVLVCSEKWITVSGFCATKKVPVHDATWSGDELTRLLLLLLALLHL